MRRSIPGWLSLITLLFLSTPAVAKHDKPETIVPTRSGLVQGLIQGELRAFRGIPYAAPPVGDLRWRPPADVVSWNGVRDASTFGPLCIQLDASGRLRGSEDCLTLNVFTAASAPVHDQPVMVFFHGGGGKRGSASEAAFDLPLLATKGVIVVTAEYRLGALGQFVHPQLSIEGGGSSGNYLLMDQIAALRWVHDNIEAFGGDEDRVMVFGQSAGSYDVHALLASPAAQGLFSRAGMESGSIPSGQTLDQAAMETACAPLSSRVGCDGAPDVLACLRAVPADVLVMNQHGLPFVLTLESRVLPADPFDVLAQNGSPVPLLIGSNREESAGLGDDPSIALDADAYGAAIHADFDPFGAGVADQVLSLYPASVYDTPRYTLIAVHSDFEITCETRSVALAAAITHEQPVWRYLFTHRFENDPDLNGLRAFHRAELFFVFGTLQAASGTGYAPSSAELELSNRMMHYWVSFASHGNPNGDGAVHWHRYTAKRERILELDETPAELMGYHVSQCNFLATLPQP